ncbi:MAG: hypothetical protein ACREQW_14020 [Candidatus Binatia bacterium]
MGSSKVFWSALLLLAVVGMSACASTGAKGDGSGGGQAQAGQEEPKEKGGAD